MFVAKSYIKIEEKQDHLSQPTVTELRWKIYFFKHHCAK